jgi:hypothetical protein
MKKKIIALIAIVTIMTIIVNAGGFFLTVSFIQEVMMRPYVFPYNSLYHDANHAIMSNFSLMPPVHTNPTVDVSFDFAIPVNWTPINSFSYSLNETTHTKLTSTSKSAITYHVYHVSGTLNDLPKGYYEIKIYANYVNGTSQEIDRGAFSVDPDFREPTLKVVSPSNQTTYHTNSVHLTYSIDSKVIWSYYALDSTSNMPAGNFIPFNGNITLTDLSEGSHRIIVSVQTVASRLSVHPISTKTIYFIIDTANAP